MPVQVKRSREGTSKVLQAILKFNNSLHNFGRGRLRLDVGVERNFAFNFFDVFSNAGLAIVDRMDDLRNDTCQWIGICHAEIIRRTSAVA